MTNAHTVHTPIAQSEKLIAAKEEQDAHLCTHYQSIGKSLMYAMLGSHPDICFTITKLSQFGSNPTKEHFHAVQCAMCYLNTTVDFKLMYGTTDTTNFNGYSDSDWAADTNDCILTTGYVYTLNGGAIAWASHKQCTVTLSLTEAEYMALTDMSKYAKWVLNLCQQLEFDMDLPINVHTDSKGAKDITRAVCHTIYSYRHLCHHP